VDALDALFPPGSVTGAPKRRACQRIAELETEPRGVYCGAIGYLSDNGSGCFNVAIRTAIQQGDSARYHIGGGIVYGSDPAQEWRETMDKARELSRAFGA
jgi:anthranilate/para-aminobenzoate synthase component I